MIKYNVVSNNNIIAEAGCDASRVSKRKKNLRRNGANSKIKRTKNCTRSLKAIYTEELTKEESVHEGSTDSKPSHPKPKVSKKNTKQKSRSKKNYNSKALNLAIRKDVVNKTILRAIRRFLINEFRSFTENSVPNKDQRSRWYFENIKRFVANKFSEHPEEVAKLQYYLASIIYQKFLTEAHATECGMEGEERTILYDCMYKYSHTRLINIIDNQPVRLIYEYFYARGLEAALDSEPVMQKNREVYLQSFKDLMDAFEHKIDVNVLVTN